MVSFEGGKTVDIKKLKFLSPEQLFLYSVNNINKVIFLDVEATSISIRYGHLSIVGTVYFEGEKDKKPKFKPFIRHCNLSKLSEHLQQFKIVVTWNGTYHDVPYSEKEFGKKLFNDIAHLDLRIIGRKFDLSGSLKKLENFLEFYRNPSIAEQCQNYKDAIKLWFSRHKDLQLLKILVLYNYFDVANLYNLFVYIAKEKYSLQVQLEYLTKADIPAVSVRKINNKIAILVGKRAYILNN